VNRESKNHEIPDINIASHGHQVHRMLCKTTGRLGAYFNCVTGGTNVPPVLAFVPPALVICPTIPDKIYGEHVVKL